MEEEVLISKKHLLQLTNISYGQLYRWKRENLLPESWFIKKSSFTGQETFFPEGKDSQEIREHPESQGSLFAGGAGRYDIAGIDKTLLQR